MCFSLSFQIGPKGGNFVLIGSDPKILRKVKVQGKSADNHWITKIYQWLSTYNSF